MRRSLPLIVLLLATASCGQNDRSRQERRDSPPLRATTSEAMAGAPAMVAADSSSPEAARARADAGPNVAPTAAPGVAFNYRYAVRLPATRVAPVQEQHAQMCERLTVARCRITGMYYHVLGNDDIEARLELKVDPGTARLFGRQAVEAVVRAEGMLTESEISGVDVGTGIRQATRSLAELTADLHRVEARLARGGLSGDERARLDYEVQQLRERIRGLRESREAQEETLATTPMVFQYGSGDLVPGFEPPMGVSQALARGWANFLEGGTVLLVILVTILPWALAALVLWFLLLFARRRWFPKKAAPVEGPAEPEAA